MNDYIEVACNLKSPEASGILTALLADLGFESFEESDHELKAYIPEKEYNNRSFHQLVKKYTSWITSVEIRHIRHENWNHLWESNFPLVEIAGRCVIFAPFHKNIPDLEYRINILPQMSFGTGHHETTSLMVEMMLDMDMAGKKVLDMGCGTAILAILAAVKKAKPVTAIDIDEWAYKNALENCSRNQVTDIEILQGDSSLLSGRHFDMILANINRNILLDDIRIYATCLPPDGLLQISGFYTSDLPDITREAERNGLEYSGHSEKKNWVAARFRKTY